MSSSFKAIPFREVVTFSAEHPQHRVRNLLSTGAGKWTSPKGHDDVFIDVELSLPSCYIKSLDIGNYWSASIDIEVGRADEASSKREPLLKCPAILMSRLNCQTGQNKEVMRFFNVDDFNPFSVGRWVDRIRIVCRQPFRKDVAFGLSEFVVRGNNLDDDSDDESTSVKGRKTYDVDMSGVEGVKKLKSKLSKQLSSFTPKSKYSSLLSSLDKTKKERHNSYGSYADEFRETITEFINDVDPDNTLEYKELLRRWVQIKGRPKTELEKAVLKEMTKSHAYGISSKKIDLSNDLVKKTFAFKRKSNDVQNSSSTKQGEADEVNDSNDVGSPVPQQKAKAKRGRPPKSKGSRSPDTQATTSARQPQPPSVNYTLKEDPQKYVDYEDRELRSAGILVHQKIYKKDKKLPLDNGEDILVEKGVLVTFYKNASFIHMKVKDRVYKPDVDPEYVPGIFKDYTEQEIAMSYKLVIEDPSSSPSVSPAKSTGSRKRKSNSPTKRVSSYSPPGSYGPTTSRTGEGAESKEEAATPKNEGSPAKKRKNRSSGGECPLCQRTFSRIKELMAHCAACNGVDDKKSPSSSSPSKAKGTPGRKKKTASAPSISSPVATSDCPICSKKVPNHELERHARLCAEKAFG